jgi:hypothetical protein
MPLFLDRLPLHFWTDRTRTPPQSHWSVVLPVLVTDPNLPAPPASALAQSWCLDTGNTGEAFAWRHHLLTAGLDPTKHLAPTRAVLTSSLGARLLVRVRAADLWLVSNIPAHQGSPFRLHLDPGIPFHDIPTLPDPNLNRPLIGLRALRRAGLRVELDFANDTVSVWTPDPPAPTP